MKTKFKTLCLSALALTMLNVASADARTDLRRAPGNLPGWTQTFSDNFDANSYQVPPQWRTYRDGTCDTRCYGRYYPSKVLGTWNGTLNWNVHSENGQRMGGAVVPKIAGQRYGRYEVRFRSDRMPGYNAVWLLWPDSEVWPRDGEIDFAEGDLAGEIKAFMHRQGATWGGDQDWYHTGQNFQSWHTATLEWMPNGTKFFLDGRLLGTSRSRIPNTPMHLVLQVETGPDSQIPSLSTRGYMEVDYVAIWKPVW